MITDRINNSLSALFNIENIRYRRLICDQDGTIPLVINKPTDIDIGAFASQVEYLRRLTIDLFKQMFIDQASGEFLEYQLEEFFSSLRLTSESDAAWVARTIAIVFQQKVSHSSIIVLLRPFSSQEPIVESVIDGSAYADFSYADVYISDVALDVDGVSEIVVLPAIAEDYIELFFTVRIILFDTDPDDILTVVDMLLKIIAAGIRFRLQILYT